MAVSCGQLLDGRDRGLGELVGTVPGRRCQRCQGPGGAFDRMAGAGIAVALAHDDEQAAVLVDPPQLGAEKSRVCLRFSIYSCELAPRSALAWMTAMRMGNPSRLAS